MLLILTDFEDLWLWFFVSCGLTALAVLYPFTSIYYAKGNKDKFKESLGLIAISDNA